MVEYFCREIVVAVDALGFGPVVTTEGILRWCQGLPQSKRYIRERTSGKTCRYERDMEKREEVVNILFQPGDRVDYNAVNPPTPRP